MDLKSYIGLKVKLAREARHLTQEQLAERVGKAVETISNIERGHTYTGLQPLEALGIALRVPLNEFFEGVESARHAPRRRVELDARLKDLVGELSLGDAEMAADLLKVLVSRSHKKPRKT